MNNNLMIFESVELEILTKDDVSIDFNGECLFNGKQVCKVLDYANDRDAINKHIRDNQKVKLRNSDVAIHDFRKLNNAGETFLTEKGVMKLIISSNMPKADEFEDKVWEIVNEVQKTGKYDSVEQQLKLIEDPMERDLKISIYQIENIVKNNPNDMLLMLTYNNKKQELTNYIQNKKISEIEVRMDKQLKTVEDIDTKIKKATVLREGDMSSEAVAKKFSIFSVNDKPHNRFADSLAKTLGFYIIPDGNSGYQDEYISINLTTRGGTTIPVIRYSQKAVKEMEEYINSDNLEFENPPTYYKRKCKGGNVGDFYYGKIIFGEINEAIKINKVTYKLYNECFED